MTRRWEDVRRPPDPARIEKARAEMDEFQTTYDRYLKVLGIPDDDHPEADELNRRTREFEDGYEMPLAAAYRMAFLEMRVENLMDELSLLQRS